MRFLLTLLLLAPAFSFAQGVNFETGNWKSVLAKAKVQNRMVYVDVYTTWCGPCKVLERTVFPQKEAGDKYNSLFVNYRIDAEKGEGIALKAKYRVTGFPTHLFINPKTEAVVYQAGGAGDVAGFNENADIALEEKADPMTWTLYTKGFSAGRRDPQFLKDYLRKANRLNKNNDAVLDAYVATLDKTNIPDSTLYFLEDNTKTIWNNAVPLLEANRTRLDTRDTGEHYYGYTHQVESWLYPSYERAVAAKDEQKLTRLIAFIKTNMPDEADLQGFFYRKMYYENTKNPVKLAAVEKEEVARILSKTRSDYKTVDDNNRKNLESSIRYQLASMALPEGANLDTIVAANIARNPKGFPSVRDAEVLNNLAWKTYENKKANPAQLAEALQWSAKAMELSEPFPVEWAANADTHASLLYRTGQKEAAVQMEEDAVKALEKAGKKETAMDYGKTIQKMKSGTY